ncbi:AraC-like ligand-binding domain-containing protein [Pseudogulbenkiania subflava]|uniref:AraC-type DNA-binding protein n=1 Tax=Pseudogulbenkiania subflava DSM 22618 TaxID=1123014 RepID=A0A1Y6CD71_9NEIS|nr:helix-turn-helix domain-containing protein [Pseudogulbenkiania subflava]SMF46812.1 AraC-type DNA-binding protein [Pseudogulbenkiania subflava DSM 22618]
MTQHFSTGHAAPQERHRLWQHIIGQAYFDLQLDFLDAARFEGYLSDWQLGELSLSRLRSSPLRYRRLRAQLSDLDNEQFLITLPRQSAIRFSQMGRDADCPPGSFILESSTDPYQFEHDRPNALWVLKIPGKLLRSRLRAPERYCALALDGRYGMGALFADYLNALGQRLEQGDDCLHPLVGLQLVELFVACAESSAGILSSQESSVRAAHLHRIENYVRQHISDIGITPDQIAAACHISTRYLHALFKDTGQTFSHWLREQRLEGARKALCHLGNGHSLATLAYQWGFTDQSHFSRVFKQRYGCTPREERERQQALRQKAH